MTFKLGRPLGYDDVVQALSRLQWPIYPGRGQDWSTAIWHYLGHRGLCRPQAEYHAKLVTFLLPRLWAVFIRWLGAY